MHCTKRLAARRGCSPSSGFARALFTVAALVFATALPTAGALAAESRSAADASFRAAIPAQSDTTQILLGGHMYGLDGWPSVGFQNAADSLETFGADAMIAGGDITTDGSSGEWDNVFTVIAGWTFPFIPVMGNHDAHDRTEWNTRFGTPYFVQDIGSTRLIALDMVYYPNSYLQPSQLAFFEQALLDAESDPGVEDVIIATHKLFWLKLHPRYDVCHPISHNAHIEFETRGNDANPFFDELWPKVVQLGSAKPTTIFAGDTGWTYLASYPALFYDVLDGVTLLACGTNPGGNANRDAMILYTSVAGDVSLQSISLWGIPFQPVENYDVPFWDAYFQRDPTAPVPPAVGPIGLDFAEVEGDEFQMFDHFDGKTEVYSPTTGYSITVSDFVMATREVTASEYVAFLNATGSNVYAGEQCIDLADPECQIEDAGGGFYQLENGSDAVLPVVEVSWHGALAYCNWLSSLDGFGPCYTGTTWDTDALGWRLPSEAEFEYAMRGGLGSLFTPTYTRFPWGDDSPNYAHDYTNYHGTGGNDLWDGLAPTGSFLPNAFGLYDMAGNASEWCYDAWTWTDQLPTVASDPVGPGSWPYQEWSVLRGGGYNFSWRGSRNAYRSSLPRKSTESYVGFRVVRSAEQPVSIVEDDVPPRGHSPARLQLHPNQPNPFNPRTTISFSLPEPGWVSVIVYDIAGRRIAILADAPYDAGEQSVVWDGKDDSGAEMASGTYYLRLAHGGEYRTGKLTLVR